MNTKNIVNGIVYKDIISLNGWEFLEYMETHPQLYSNGKFLNYISKNYLFELEFWPDILREIDDLNILKLIDEKVLTNSFIIKWMYSNLNDLNWRFENNTISESNIKRAKRHIKNIEQYLSYINSKKYLINISLNM